MSRGQTTIHATPVDVFHATGQVEVEGFGLAAERAGRPVVGDCLLRILRHEMGAVVILDAGDHGAALHASLPTLVPHLVEEFSLPSDPRRLWVLDHHEQLVIGSGIAGADQPRDGFARIHVGRGNHSEGNCAWEPIANPKLGYERVALLLGDQFCEWYPHLSATLHRSAHAEAG